MQELTDERRADKRRPYMCSDSAHICRAFARRRPSGERQVSDGSMLILTDRRGGGALPIVVMVMMVISVLGAGLLHIGGQDGVETARALQAKQSFWLAEAGLAEGRFRLVQRLEQDPLNRDSMGFTVPMGDGQQYAVGVTIANETNVTIVSTGTVHGASRVLRQSMALYDWQWAFRFGLSGYGGTWTIANNCTLTNGDYYFDGNIVFGNNVKTNGSVFMTPSPTNISGISSNVWQAPPDPPPTLPPLDTTYYDTAISIASQLPAQDVTLSNTTNLMGSTRYYHGDLTITAPSIIGPGTLVATGNITIENRVNLTTNITLISGGKIDVQNGFSSGGNTLLYARVGVDINNNGSAITGTAIVTPGYVDFKNSFVFQGAIYAVGSFTMKNGGTIQGSVVCGTGAILGNNSKVTYDANQLPDSLPGLDGNYYLMRGRWEQLGGS